MRYSVGSRYLVLKKRFWKKCPLLVVLVCCVGCPPVVVPISGGGCRVVSCWDMVVQWAWGVITLFSANFGVMICRSATCAVDSLLAICFYVA